MPSRSTRMRWPMRSVGTIDGLGNLVRLDDEPLDDDGQTQGDRDDHDQLRH